MTDAKALVERLRWLSHNSGWGDDATAKDAADLIEQQAAEIAALRADADALAAQVLHLKGGTNGANS